jgi:hypothetical protein
MLLASLLLLIPCCLVFLLLLVPCYLWLSAVADWFIAVSGVPTVAGSLLLLVSLLLLLPCY